MHQYQIHAECLRNTILLSKCIFIKCIVFVCPKCYLGGSKIGETSSYTQTLLWNFGCALIVYFFIIALNKMVSIGGRDNIAGCENIVGCEKETNQGVPGLLKVMWEQCFACWNTPTVISYQRLWLHPITCFSNRFGNS